MARKHYGKAILSDNDIHYDKWMETIRTSGGGLVSKDHLHRVAKSVTQKCDPTQYLLSHATIVSSVDTYTPRTVKLGKQLMQGSEINVQFPDYRIRPETHQYVNNNKDAFSRGVLLTTYKTFVGAQNYLEHIQVPELSKGFIVDAVARDLGDTVYIDILVATSRIHTQLVEDITTGKLDSMSMGTISLFTVCSRCGNVASDDASICPCIAYMGKGSTFQDEDGHEHPIVELIGHSSIPNSNQFIEASWVGNPAFRGATRRNLLNPESSVSSDRMAASLEVNRTKSVQVHDLNSIWKSASLRTAEETEEAGPAPEEEAAPTEDAPEEEADAPKEEEAPATPDAPKGDEELNKMVDSARKQLMEKILEGILEQLGPKAEDVGSVDPGPIDLERGNDNLVHAFDRGVQKLYPTNPQVARHASTIHRKLQSTPRGRTASGLSFTDLVFYTYVRRQLAGQSVDAKVYRIIASLGNLHRFPSENSYVATLESRLSRRLSATEKKQVLFCVRTSSMCDD